MSAAKKRPLRVHYTVQVLGRTRTVNTQARPGPAGWIGEAARDKIVVENGGNRCILPIKVPSVVPPDRCFLFVPVRLTGSSLHSIVVCPQRGHEDTFIMFSREFSADE